MKVSQYRTFQELWKFLQVQSQKPSSAIMKLALMRTATGKEDPELPLLQRISSLELPASEIAAQIHASQSSSNRHISTWTVQRRLRKNKRYTWLGQETWTMDIKRVKIFLVPTAVSLWRRWTDDLCMCGSHREVWRRRCDGVAVLCWWHCLWFI